MRRFCLLLVLALPAAGILATAPVERAAAQKPEAEFDQPEDQPVSPRSWTSWDGWVPASWAHRAGWPD